MVIYDTPSYTVAAVQLIDKMDATKIAGDDVQNDDVQDDDVHGDDAQGDAKDRVLDDSSLLFS
jgi:hypothetical protein